MESVNRVYNKRSDGTLDLVNVNVYDYDDGTPTNYYVLKCKNGLLTLANSDYFDLENDDPEIYEDVIQEMKIGDMNLPNSEIINMVDELLKY